MSTVNKSKWLLLVLLASPSVYAMERAYGDCSSGGVQVNVPAAGGQSTTPGGQPTYWQQSFPSCLITVYLSGITSISLSTVTRSSNVVTAALTGNFPTYGKGASVTVTGVTGFNGTFTVTSVLSPTSITWSQTGANASASGGSASFTAQIYSDNGITVASNPFTSDNTGHWFFYASNGHYDVARSGIATLGDVLLDDPANAGTSTLCYASNFVGVDLTAQTAAAFASGCTIVVWSGLGTLGSGPTIVNSGNSISCGPGIYTEINGGTTPTAIEFVNGTQNAGFIGTGGCNVVNHQTPAYSEANNVPSATFLVCSQIVANCDTTAPDTSTVLTANCTVGATSCSVTSLTGLFAGQDVVIGSNRGDGAYVISPSWNGANPVVFTRPMDDSYTTANGAFLGFFTNGFTKYINISNVNITGNCAKVSPCVGHGIFTHNAFYSQFSNVQASALGGRIAVANGYSAFLDYDHFFYDASQSIASTNNGFEPGYVLTSHTRADNSSVVGAPANCIAFHGYHVQSSNLQGFGCGESGLQLDTLEDYSDVGSQYINNGTNGINVAGDSGNNYATDIKLIGDTVDGNADNGVGAGIGGNVKIFITRLKAYGNLGNNAADGGGVFFDAVQAGSMVTDSVICGGARGIYLDGTNSFLTFANITFQPQGNCTANTVGDLIVRASSGAVTNSEFTNINFGATQPIPTATCTYLTAGSLANTFWGLTSLGSQCSASSGLWTIPSSITLATQGMSLTQLTSLAFSATGTPTLNLNGANAIVVGSTGAGGGTFPLVTVGTLPSATSVNGSLFVVSDSTTVTVEGQTCAGTGTTRALAFASGGVWKCF